MKGITTHEINHRHYNLWQTEPYSSLIVEFCIEVELHDLEKKSNRVLCDKNCDCHLNK